MAERSSGVRELSVIGIGTSTPTIKSSGNLNIDASTVAIGATLTVGDKLQLLGNSTSLAGTAGTSGDIRMFYGSPFIHDGIAWREFPLKEGVPVTESADTDWDDVIYRNDFNTSFTDQKFSYAPSVATNSYLVGAPVKFGEKSLRLNNTSDFRYDHRSDYVFAGPWTIEGWFYFNTLPTQTGGNATALISKTAGSSNDWAIIVEQGTTTTKTDFKWYNTQTHGTNYSGTKIGVEDDVNLINQWNHIAIVRESSDGSIHFYLNGVESNYTASGSGVIDNNIVDHISYELIFGNSYLHSTKFNGCIDDLRISTVARYLSADGSFTPPTEPYPTTGTLSGPVDPPYFGSTLEKVIAGTAISSFSNVSDATPSSGQVLKWNGSLWAPASDNTSAGGTGIGLTDLSISTNPVGINSLSYDDTTGTFTFTPTSLVGYATEGYVDNAVVGIATTGYVDNAIVGFITSGASAAELIGLTGASAGTYGDFDKSAQITVDSNGRITGITEIGITTDGAGIDVSGISTFNDNVSFGSTILVDGAVNLAVNNATLAGTAGTTGDIKMIGGAPFFYDGTTWREFALTTGTPVTTGGDTDWDNVMLRLDFENSTNNLKDDVPDTRNLPAVGSPVKVGSKSLSVPGTQYGAEYANTYSTYSYDGPWTIEMWIYVDTLPQRQGTGSETSDGSSLLFHTWDTGFSDEMAFGVYNSDTGTSVGAGLTGDTYKFYYYNNTSSKDGTGDPGNANRPFVLESISGTNLLNTWNHVALVRRKIDGKVEFYLNGSKSSNYVYDMISGLTQSEVSTTAVGSYTLNSAYRRFYGNIDDVRITKDERYTSNFTAPTTAHPTTGTTSTVYTPPNSKEGELTLGASPTWTGTAGVTVSQVASGQYRLEFSSPYSGTTGYTVSANMMDYTDAGIYSPTSIVGVGVRRVNSQNCDLYVRKLSDNSVVDTGSLAVSVYKK